MLPVLDDPVPISCNTSVPNTSTILLYAGFPSTTSLAIISASITGMLQFTKHLRHVLFPLAMPPVNPITTVIIILLIIKGAKLMFHAHTYIFQIPIMMSNTPGRNVNFVTISYLIKPFQVSFQ